jgi:hypothetical protein
MVFSIVTPSDPWGQWFVQIWIYIILESFHVNMSYSSSVVLERKIINDPTPFLQYCDYLPFGEDPALNLNNFEFPLPKDDLC